MSGFKTLAEMKHVDGKRWMLTEPLVYAVQGVKTITVPKGFVTDYASLPRPLLAVFGRPSGITAEPAVLHDWLYSPDGLPLLARYRCDEIFLESMKSKGVNWFKRYAMYHGVRVFGAAFYKAKK